MDRAKAEWIETMNQLDLDATYASMDDPAALGTSQINLVLAKSREQGYPHSEVLRRLTDDFHRQNIFRKVQSFHGVAILFVTTSNLEVKAAAEEFLWTHREGELPLLSQVECTLLRLMRKRNVLFLYPELRPHVEKALDTSPEIVRYVDPPNPLSLSYEAEVNQHHRSFVILKTLSEEQLAPLLKIFLQQEAEINAEFWKARGKLSASERELGGFETYGEGGRHYVFPGILKNLRIRFEGRDVASNKTTE
jgi:hypothetical protein